MFFYILRHGRPDYATDTLLEEGKHQAELLAERMQISGLDAVYSSPMGRALETAAPTAEKLGLPITVLPWARELGDEARTRYPDGVSKVISRLPDAYFYDPAVRDLSSEEAMSSMDCFTDNQYAERYKEISEGLDALLEKHGYRRNGRGLYETAAPNDSHVGLFCHGGMTRIMLSHLFHLPCTRVAAAWQGHFTNVTVLYFDENPVGETAPVLVSYGDVGHLYRDGSAPRLYTKRKEF